MDDGPEELTPEEARRAEIKAMEREWLAGRGGEARPEMSRREQARLERWVTKVESAGAWVSPSSQTAPRGLGGWTPAVVLLGVLGGLIGYFSEKDANPARANHIMKWGLIWTVVWSLVWAGLIAAS